MFNALATLRSHGHLDNIRDSSLGLLERGLVGIRDVVRTTLTIYRTDGVTRELAPTDIEDLGLLIAPEARRKGVQIKTENTLVEIVPLSSTPIRQAVLNLLLNAVAATPDGSQVNMSAVAGLHELEITVADRGPGLPDAAAEILTSRRAAPPPPDGGGLGLWTTSRLITDIGGRIEVGYPAHGGTAITLKIPIVRMELSNVA
jgi:signal transduction histidine kinase